MSQYLTESRSTVFIYHLIQEHLRPRQLEDLIEGIHYQDNFTGTWLSNEHLGRYAEEIAAHIDGGQLKAKNTQIAGLQARLLHAQQENTKLLQQLRTEREALTSWIAARIMQQKQALEAKLSTETTTLIQTEISFLERYLDAILRGDHRPDPALLGIYG